MLSAPRLHPLRLRGGGAGTGGGQHSSCFFHPSAWGPPLATAQAEPRFGKGGGARDLASSRAALQQRRPGGVGEMPSPLNSQGFPGGAHGKESAWQCRRHKRHRFDPWVGKIPWRRAWQPTPVFLPGEFHGQRSLVDYSPWGSQRVGHNWET